MSPTFEVREVFQIGGRTVIAIDKAGEEVRAGDRFHSADGTELTIRSIAFVAPEAWAAGRRGLQVEVKAGELVVGQEFHKSE
ncbi:MAG TPA: hypothetical protein VEA99_21165 [Gemmatimonadaceae bacterium]|nr:hypothetical protein [Gemmatimonadaceae bacterium]